MDDKLSDIFHHGIEQVKKKNLSCVSNVQCAWNSIAPYAIEETDLIHMWVTDNKRTQKNTETLKSSQKKTH